ncbi:MAG: hypothetical protein ABSE49_18250 [Polyangiaceae bacterium]
MNIPGFTQVPCPRCGQPVMVAQATGTGFCRCGNQVTSGAAPGAAPPGAGPGAMPGMGGMPGMPRMNFPQVGAGGSPKAKIFGAVAVAVVLIIGGGAWSAFKTDMFGAGGKGNIGYGQLSIDPKKPDGDAMMLSVAGLATKWKRDAVWWGTNYLAVHPDGTVDVEQGATVTYASLSSAQSLAKSVNKDSLKEFSFGPTGVNFSRMTGVLDPTKWANAKAPELPRCTIKKLAQSLASKGLTGSKTVRITYDQQFAFAGPAEPSWRVIGEDPKMDSYFSMATCAQTK